MTESEFNDPIFREACRKYRALQDSNKSIKLLEAAKRAAD
nr:MAG TPA: ubiquitin carboxyl-terminal hydrolase [Bacteriophage sp.]